MGVLPELRQRHGQNELAADLDAAADDPGRFLWSAASRWESGRSCAPLAADLDAPGLDASATTLTPPPADRRTAAGPRRCRRHLEDRYQPVELAAVGAEQRPEHPAGALTRYLLNACTDEPAFVDGRKKAALHNLRWPRG